MPKILLAEDDLELQWSLKKLLETERFVVDATASGQEALDRLLSLGYDAVILDWGLPEISGIEICQDARSRGSAIPILMLTGKDTIFEKERGLESGADDYLTKPFHPRELLARLKALLRRAGGHQSDSISFGPLVVEFKKRLVRRDGQEVRLQPMEFTLLEFLLKNPDDLFSVEALLSRLWSNDAEVSLEAAYTCIKRLRKKLDWKGRASIIRTVHAVGYGANPEYGEPID